MRRLLVGLCLLGAACGQAPERVAWVGPASTPSGEQAVRGMRIYLARSRAPVRLDVYDDNDDPARAREVAEKIAASHAVAVIGHHNAEAAKAGAEIYRQKKIPYVTAYATDPAITKGNPWAFRALPNDDMTARTLAHYVAVNWPDATVTFVGNDNTATSFASAWKDARGGDVLRPKSLEEISLAHPIVITESADTTATVLKFLRSRGFNRPVVSDREATTSAFFAALGDVSAANGVHVAETYNFDIADRNGGIFRRDFQDRYDRLPTWEAALASDALAVIAETLPVLSQTALAARRTELQSALQNTPGVRATTGVVWFNGDGDRGEPRAMGVLHDGKMETALVQLYPDLHQRKYVTADVVLTGVRTLGFEEVDLENGVFVANVHMWFRYRPNVSLDGLTLLNAATVGADGQQVTPVTFESPDVEKSGEGWRYRLYKKRLVLRSDHFNGNFGERTLGVSYRHGSRTRGELFFAGDSVGMGVQTAKTRTERMNQVQQLLPRTTNYAIKRVISFEDGYYEHSLGDPAYLDRRNKAIEYSRFNIGVAIAPSQVTPRRVLEVSDATWIAAAAAFLLLLVFFAGRRAKGARRWLFILQVAGAVGFLLAFEVLIGDYLIVNTGRAHLRTARLLFDAAWWFVPAMLIATAVNCYIWDPLESRTQRAVPTILKGFLSFTIYLLAMFGIIAFVFDQKLTSLLATSGVFAMIIGLAIQINITNIFSGIALNLERPFKVGDWIMIHGRTPDPGSSIIGCVVDINWRTTRLKTTSRSIVVIPNGVISEKTITNFMAPTEVSRFELIFGVDTSVPSETVLATIRKAVSSLAGKTILEDPKSKVRIDGSSSDGVMYSVRYFIVPRETSPAKARHAVTESVLRHLADEDITLAQNPRDVRYRPLSGPPLDLEEP